MSESVDPLVKSEIEDAMEEEPAAPDPQHPVKLEPVVENEPESVTLNDPLRLEEAVCCRPVTCTTLQEQVSRCQICNHALPYTEVNIGPKGLSSLQRVSDQLQDNRFPPGFTGTVQVHKDCRRKYINDKTIRAAVRKMKKALEPLQGEVSAVDEDTDDLEQNESVTGASELALSESSGSEALTPAPLRSEPVWKTEVSRCQICDHALPYMEVNIGPKGLLSLQGASDQLQDNRFPPGFTGTVQVHKECRKRYVNVRNIKAAARRRKKALEPPQGEVSAVDEDTDDLEQNGSVTGASELSLSEPSGSEALTPAPLRLEPVWKTEQFDYLTQCLFCGGLASDPPGPPGRRVCRVRDRGLGPRLYRTSLDLPTKDTEEFRNRVKDKDLVALCARYHMPCHRTFMLPRKPQGTLKRGRPPCPELQAKMELVYDYIENNFDDSQFALEDISKATPISDPYTLVRKIEERYSILRHRSSIVIKPPPTKLLEEKWHEQKLEDERSEKLRIIRTAANIILEDIRAIAFDNEHYTSPSSFSNECNSVVPETLRTFMETVVTKYKKNPEALDSTVVALSHSVMMAARPRTFKSPILLSIGSLIHQKYAAKSLIDMLSSIGFCAPYKEVTKFEVSAVFHNCPETQPDFTQFVFDSVDSTNGDIIVGVQCDTPGAVDTPITRLVKPPADLADGEYKTFLKQYPHGASGLKEIMIEDHRDDMAILPTRGDALYLFGKTDPSINIPGWEAFMSKMPRDEHPMSEIRPLPIIDAPPAYDSIYTALKKAQKNTEGICVVTFNQPMYQKAQEIVSSDSEMSNVILRLGGFDVLKSFLGVIGYIMSGSGLKELWCSIYAAEHIEKMMTGHAYARAIRAHFLTRSALFNIITKDFDLTPEERLEIDGILEGDCIPQSESQAGYQEPLIITLELLLKRGPVAQLWVQYFRMTTLIAQFIEAERTANWGLHLSTIKKMLPYFHAGGYFEYAKSCSLYLQDMQALESKMTAEEYEGFSKKGYFAVRWTEKLWASSWSDQVVAKTMATMKRPGGITNGRQVADCALPMWLAACPLLSRYSDLAEEFCRPSEEASKNNDNEDIAKLKSWFQEHNPFPETWKLTSLTGLGGEDATCHKAEEVGNLMMAETIGQSFQEVIYKRDKCVRPLSSSVIQIENCMVPIEPDTILKRIRITDENVENFQTFFECELAPYPMSMFNDQGMLEANRSSMFELFVPVVVGEGTRSHIVDGEFLLHRVSWKEGATVSAIAYSYVEYVKTHFSNAIVVFGANKGSDTNRSKPKTKSPILEFQKDTVITIGREKFLSNERNKDRFIQCLIIDFARSGIKIKLSSKDVHSEIVHTAMANACTYEKACVVSDNVDLLIEMCIISDEKNMYFMKPGRGKKLATYYHIDNIKSNKTKDIILFIHAVSGCDTTSGIFGQGKVSANKIINRGSGVRRIMSIFSKPGSDKDDIADEGESFIKRLYGDSYNDLKDVRCYTFVDSETRSRYDLASMPPSKGAIRQHMYRTYYQVQKWLGNELPPTEWGWKLVEDRLEPIPTLEDIAPQELLDMISCKCDGACSRLCVCKRAGLECCVLCINCNGKSCHGVDMDEDSFEVGYNTLLRCDPYGNPVDYLNVNNDNDDEDEDGDELEKSSEPPSPREKRVKRGSARNDEAMGRELEQVEVYIPEEHDS